MLFDALWMLIKMLVLDVPKALFALLVPAPLRRKYINWRHSKERQQKK